jgi:drug/metabolite transporter (DMT)-like permease
VGVVLAVLAAVAAAVCYGVGSVLQSISARRSAAAEGLDPRLLVRLLGDLPYLAGLSLDLLGFLASVVALHRLPLFFVQAAITSSVGVTVLLSVVVLGTKMHRVEIVALVVMGVGLLLLAVAARPERAHLLPRPAQWAVLGGVAVVAILGVAASRIPGPSGAVCLAIVAGLGFTGVGIAARALLVPHHLVRLVGEPLAWAIAGYGVLATLLFATALQRGSLTTTVAITFVVETVVPAVVGLTLLGDQARPGLGPVAAVGFVLTVTGAVTLARYSASPTPIEVAQPK